MKTIYTILFLIFFASLQAQTDFYISSGTSVNVSDDNILYSKSKLTNEGEIIFSGTLGTGDLYFDGDIDNTGGALTLNDAILHLGSGSATRSTGNVTYKFNAGGDFNALGGDFAKFVEFNKISGNATVDATGGFLNITQTLTSSLTDGSYVGKLLANDRVVLKNTTYPSVAIVGESSRGGNQATETFQEVRVERFYPANRAYRMISSPVESTNTMFNLWQQGGLNPGDVGYIENLGTQITFGTGVNGFDQNSTGKPSLFEINATNTGFAPVEDNTNVRTLQLHKPYFLLVRGDRRINLLINDTQTAETTLLNTGSLHIGSHTVTGTSVADGFSLIANPYQAPVDMKAVLKTNTKGFIWVWDPQIAGGSGEGGYVSIDLSDGTNNVTGSNATEYVQPGQSFFIQTLNGGTAAQLNFSEANKANSTVLTDIFREPTQNTNDGFMRFTLYSDGLKVFEDVANDGVVIRFDDKYNNTNEFNASKLFSGRENISIKSNNGELSFYSNTLPEDYDEIIDLTMTNFGDKTADFSFAVELEGMETLPEGIILWDKYKGTYTKLEDQQVIKFSVDKAIPETSAANRFAFVFKNQTLGFNDQSISDIRVYPNPVTSNFIDIQFSQANNTNTTVELYDLLGKKILSKNFDNVQSNLRIDNLDLSVGVYLMNVKQDNQSKTFKIIKE